MEGLVKISDLKELEFKGGQKVLLFNILYAADPEEDEDLFLALPGFILMAGSIYPPKSKRKGTWYPVCYLGRTIAEKVYEKLFEKLVTEGLQEKYKLNSCNTAINELVNENGVSRLFPSVVGSF